MGRAQNVVYAGCTVPVRVHSVVHTLAGGCQACRGGPVQGLAQMRALHGRGRVHIRGLQRQNRRTLVELRVIMASRGVK